MGAGNPGTCNAPKQAVGNKHRWFIKLFCKSEQHCKDSTQLICICQHAATSHHVRTRCCSVLLCKSRPPEWLLHKHHCAGHAALACLQTYLPGNVGLPTPPSLTEMLQYGACLVLLDTLWHHVQDVMHDSRSQLQVKMGLNALFGNLHARRRVLELSQCHK